MPTVKVAQRLLADSMTDRAGFFKGLLAGCFGGFASRDRPALGDDPALSLACGRQQNRPGPPSPIRQGRAADRVAPLGLCCAIRDHAAPALKRIIPIFVAAWSGHWSGP